MGNYDSDDAALIGLARQLTDAYGEARTREDQDYACEAILDFLGEYRRAAPSEALLALLDLPFTAETFPLIDEAQMTLVARGPAVVELLLAAALGEVYDQDGPAPERAAETLDSMDPGEASLGLVEVLGGDADDQLKAAAVDALVALGGIAEPDLVGALDDLAAAEWARAALAELRFAREHPGEESEDDRDEDAAEDDEEAEQDEEAEAGPEAEDAGDEPAPGSGAAGGIALADGPAAAGGPDQALVDDAYGDFIRRFEQESGEAPGDEPAP